MAALGQAVAVGLWNLLDQAMGAQEAELKASEFDGRESGQAKDRAIAIIQDAPPPDVSPSEQQAVDKREKELKDLMGLNPPPEARTPKPAPAAAAAPPPTPTVDPAQQAASECMAKNARNNEKDIERLGNLAAAAADAGDVAKAMVRVVRPGGLIRLLEYVRPSSRLRQAITYLWQPWIH